MTKTLTICTPNLTREQFVAALNAEARDVRKALRSDYYYIVRRAYFNGLTVEAGIENAWRAYNETGDDTTNSH